MNFKIFNIPVTVKWSFWILSLLIGSNFARQTNGRTALPILASFVGILFVSILIHELGHALWARWYGMTPSIEIHLFGGTARYTGTKQLTHGQNLMISLAGPVSNILLAGLSFIFILFLAYLNVGVNDKILSMIVFINLFLGIFNLLPLYPMDGGYALNAGLKKWKGPTGAKLSYQISFIMALAFASLSFYTGNSIMALMLGYFAFLSYKMIKSPESTLHFH